MGYKVKRFKTFLKQKDSSKIDITGIEKGLMYAVVGFPYTLEGDRVFLLDAPISMNADCQMGFTGMFYIVITEQELKEHFEIYDIKGED